MAGALRAETARQQLTQRELATRVGKSQPWVTYRLSGKVPCDVEDLELLARALGVTVGSLLPAEERAA